MIWDYFEWSGLAIPLGAIPGDERGRSTYLRVRNPYNYNYIYRMVNPCC